MNLDPEDATDLKERLDKLITYLKKNSPEEIIEKMESNDYAITEKGKQAILDSDPEEIADELNECLTGCY